MPSTLTTTPSLSLALGCSNTHQSNPNKIIVYKPGDLIPAFIKVHKHRPLEALSLHGSLIGTHHFPHRLQRLSMLTLPFRRNPHLDQPPKPPRHLPNHDPHAPRPQRRLLARPTFHPEHHTRKCPVRTADVCPPGIRYREQAFRIYQQQAAPILRNRRTLRRPLGARLHAAAD